MNIVQKTGLALLLAGAAACNRQPSMTIYYPTEHLEQLTCKDNPLPSGAEDILGNRECTSEDDLFIPYGRRTVVVRSQEMLRVSRPGENYVDPMRFYPHGRILGYLVNKNETSLSVEPIADEDRIKVEYEVMQTLRNMGLSISFQHTGGEL